VLSSTTFDVAESNSCALTLVPNPAIEAPEEIVPCGALGIGSEGHKQTWVDGPPDNEMPVLHRVQCVICVRPLEHHVISWMGPVHLAPFLMASSLTHSPQYRPTVSPIDMCRYRIPIDSCVFAGGCNQRTDPSMLLGDGVEPNPLQRAAGLGCCGVPVRSC
jgi:hypothetical protein